jgi:hypothetical protein
MLRSEGRSLTRAVRESFAALGYGAEKHVVKGIRRRGAADIKKWSDVVEKAGIDRI